jgi:hypothetical protein
LSGDEEVDDQAFITDVKYAGAVDQASVIHFGMLVLLFRPIVVTVRN